MLENDIFSKIKVALKNLSFEEKMQLILMYGGFGLISLLLGYLSGLK